MELIKTVRERYKEAGRKERTTILTEFCENTGFHRKAAIRTFNKPQTHKKRSGARSKYHPYCTLILKEIWKTMDHICPERFYGSISDILYLIQSHHPKEYVTQVRQMSLMTVRRRIESLPRPTTRLRKTNKSQYTYDSVPVNSHLRKAQRFGYVGVDFVDHNGGDTSGTFCRTLTLADVKTLWTTNGACFGRTQEKVEKVFDIALHRYPKIPIHELHPDNEDALLAVSLLKKESRKRCILSVTRSRPSKKNDNCHVEERNNERVRKHVGYKRYTQKHVTILNRLYEKLDDYSNFFIPSMKLKGKIYNQNHKPVRRILGKSMTPYQRVLECDEVEIRVKMSLMQKYRKLDILKLRTEIDVLLRKLAHS
jgi:hypothetical protein